MDRRTFIRSTAAAAAVGATAGCLGAVGLGGNPDVTLREPDRPFESEDVPYPAWGQRVADVTLPAPIAGGSLSLRDPGEPSLFTFFYSHCETVCPVLISTLRNVQAHAQENEYADEVTFAPVTFDPARDTADRLETYAEEMNVTAAGDGWRFLRPESKERAKTVVQEEFGVDFRRTEPEEMEMYMFAHTSLTLLVNADGYVERAYQTSSPDQEAILDDLTTLREA
ncbi:SCO family protein [Halolamina rubra]|uniref:SCO family protein n=1 Tax=Halolamina rubra TaxID=1380430 RepID=UPI0006789BDC|nr:SCO family protein [Halolamina rubra]